MKSKLFKTFFFLYLILASTLAWSLPEMIRYNYASCNVCHVNITGGGVLNDNGRIASAHYLSSSEGFEGEKEAYWDLFERPDNFFFGGGVRLLQTYRETETYKEGKFFLMQADIEAAYSDGEVTVVATAGREEIQTGNKSKGKFVSRRHYVQRALSPDTYLRAGKFLQSFGINTPDHATATKRGLGMNHGSETYNLELAQIGSSLSLFFDLVFGRPDQEDLNKSVHKGVAFTGSWFFGERYRVGASFFQGRNETSSRRQGGPWFMGGITEKAFVLFEQYFVESWTNRDMTGKPVSGFGVNSKQGYEVMKGLVLYIMEDFSKQDVAQKRPSYQAIGPGVQWFPRPHLEVNAQYQKQILSPAQEKFSDFAWVMTNIYL